MRYFKLAADQGNDVAQCQYGLCLLIGQGVDQDCREGVAYIKMAADQGFAGAQCTYGICLVEGQGVDSDWNEAASYFRAAACQGLPAGEMSYGMSSIIMTKSGHCSSPHISVIIEGPK